MNQGEFTDDLFMVDPRKIVISDTIGDGGFANPRHFHRAVNKEKGLLGLGFQDEKMERLRADIKLRGIQNPLVCRKVVKDGEEELHLLAGERRLRCSLDLNLPTVPCHIKEMSDKDAWVAAIRCNDTAEPIGDNATAGLVKYLQEEEGYEKDDILAMFDRSEQWLKKMNTLGELDPLCFRGYEEGRLTLRVAEILAKIDDLDLRHQLYKDALADAEQVWEDRLAKFTKAVDRAEDKVETAKATVSAAKLLGADPATVDEAEKEQEEAEEKLEEAKDAIENHAKTTPQVKNKSLTEAGKKAGAQHQVAAALGKAKIKKLYLDKLDSFIENDGKDDEDEYLCEVEVLRIVREVVNGILSGEKDLSKVLHDVLELIPAEDDVEEEEFESEADFEAGGDLEYDESDEVDSVVPEDDLGYVDDEDVEDEEESLI